MAGATRPRVEPGATGAAQVLPLSAVGPGDAARVGGKAAGLGALIAAGLPVPEGVVVTVDACAALLAGAGLGGAPGELARRVRAPAAPDEASWLEGVQARVRAAPVPATLAAALRDALGPLLSSGAALAVRSSGAQEDLAHASFAGQYESVLGARGEPALHDALRTCLASLFGARLAPYLRGRGGTGDGLGMAVVVQRLVEPDVAGVLFTVNPVTGREEETVIEAVLGLGEAHVAGRSAADHLVVLPSSGVVAERRTAAQAIRLRLGPEGAREEPVPAADASRPKLSDAEALALAELGAIAQEHLGRPLDVEWVRAGGAFHLVQARPVTRLHFAEDVGEWTTADFRDGGVSADVCSRLMWSLYELAFDRSMGRYLASLGLVPRTSRAKWTRMFFARPYWNVAEAKAAVLPLPGFVERNFDLDLGIVPAYDGPGRTTPATFRTVLRAVPVLARLLRGYLRRLAANARFVAAFPARAARYDLDPAALAVLGPEALAAGWRSLVEELFLDTETSYFETIYNTSNAKLDFSVAFARANARAAGGLEYAKLVGGLTDLSHLRPMKDLHRLLGDVRVEGRPLLDAEVEAFARRWPQRGRKELDLRVPRWPDDLPFVRALMERTLASWRPEEDPEVAARAQHAVYEAERDRALAALGGRPLARAAFRRRLRRLRRFTWWREEMRDRSSHVYALVRRWALEAGRRLAQAGALAAPDDVFHLRREELAAALEGALPPAEVRRLAAGGGRLLRSFRNFRNPNEIRARQPWEDVRPSADGPVLRGTPCAPGRARGPARVVRAIEESDRIAPGDVLVAPFTDPGWTPLFARLGAVVTETGGLLSHAAVIAREYGIPAVLAVADATHRIPEGAQVAVDGGRGTIEIAAEEGG